MTKKNYNFIIFFSFLLLVLVYRYILPYSDEPDFVYQSFDLLTKEHSFLSPYKYLNNFLHKIYIETELSYVLNGLKTPDNYIIKCSIESPLKLFYVKIPSLCHESFESIVYRFFLLFILISPLITLLILPNLYLNIIRSINQDLNNNHIALRIQTIWFSLITPSILYPLGFFSTEQFFLIVALIFFLFFNTILIVPIIIYCFLIDTGNTIVLFIFTIFYYLNKVSFQYLRKNFISLIIFNLLFIVIVFFSSLNLMNIVLGIHSFITNNFLNIIFYFFINLDFYYLSNFFDYLLQINQMIGHKLVIMEYELITSGEYFKYPRLLRPVITFISYIYFPPSGIKVPLIYILIIGLIIFIFFNSAKLIKNNLDFKKEIYHDMFIKIISSFITILFFVFMFPTYANAKYYVFLMPFFLYPVIHLYDHKKIYYCIILINLLLTLNIIVFWE